MFVGLMLVAIQNVVEWLWRFDYVSCILIYCYAYLADNCENIQQRVVEWFRGDEDVVLRKDVMYLWLIFVVAFSKILNIVGAVRSCFMPHAIVSWCLFFVGGLYFRESHNKNALIVLGCRVILFHENSILCDVVVIGICRNPQQHVVECVLMACWYCFI